MIKVRFDKFWTPFFLTLFFALFAAKLWVYPNLFWMVVGLPIYAPPLISLVIALYQLYKFKKDMRISRTWNSPEEMFKEFGI